ASGMAAIACTLDKLLPHGSHLIASRVVYGGTYTLLANLLPRRGVSVSFVDMDDAQAVEAAVRPETKALYVESLSNPLLTVPDFDLLTRLKKKHGLSLVVDNTFTPCLLTPGA